jgi:hypothetical protein
MRSVFGADALNAESSESEAAYAETSRTAVRAKPHTKQQMWWIRQSICEEKTRKQEKDI